MWFKNKISFFGKYSWEKIDELVADGYIPVANADELDALRNTTLQEMGVGTRWKADYTTGLDKKYIQVNHIDCSGIANFVKLQLTNDAIYLGNQLEIRNITQTTTGDAIIDRGGIFQVSEQVEMHDVIIKNATISTQGRYSGILIALQSGTSIVSGCVVIDSSVTSTDNQVGGLAGIITHEAEISNCVVINCSVNGQDYVGGAFGKIGFTSSDSSIADNIRVHNSSIEGKKIVGGCVGSKIVAPTKISNSFCSNSTVTSTSTTSYAMIGGFFGNDSTSAGGETKQCWSINNTVLASGTQRRYAGGFVGYNQTGITTSDCYSLNNTVNNNSADCGGFVGRNQAGTLLNCYSTSIPTGTSAVGGFAGSNVGTITNAYYDTETSGQSDTGKGLPRTTAQMQEGTADSVVDGDAMYTAWDDAIWDFRTNLKYPKNKKL